MKKLIIILPILVSLLVISGFAGASTQERVNSDIFSIDASFSDYKNITCGFGKAADDGGALGEKAICQAMLQQIEKPQSGLPQMMVQIVLINSQAASPATWPSLTAIREDEV